jgi:hypothetical protein
MSLTIAIEIEVGSHCFLLFPHPRCARPNCTCLEVVEDFACSDFLCALQLGEISANTCVPPRAFLQYSQCVPPCNSVPMYYSHPSGKQHQLVVLRVLFHVLMQPDSCCPPTAATAASSPLADSAMPASKLCLVILSTAVSPGGCVPPAADGWSCPFLRKN